MLENHTYKFYIWNEVNFGLRQSLFYISIDLQELEHFSDLDRFPSYTESTLDRIYCTNIIKPW